MREIPAVSVIIPMYNAAKYIGDCLDSLLTQTFTDFEVIIVDDCSTDNSVAVVEGYRERFGGRLTLSRMETNTGSGALPRNKGLQLSCGEYIAFLDNDDMFTKTALEELYTLAKDYDADVVYCEDNYRVNPDGTGIHREIGTTINKPTFESNDMAERVKQILRFKYDPMQWRKLVRRNLIIEYEIFFPNTRPSDDDIWTYGLVFCAKKILRVPNLTYIRRLTGDSIMRVERTPQQTINFWLNPVLLGLKALDNFMSKHEFFQRNLLYRYAVLEMFVKTKSNIFLKDSFKLPPPAVYETIKREFGDRLGDHDVLIAALCTALNTQQKISSVERQKFNQFAAQARARIATLEAQGGGSKARRNFAGEVPAVSVIIPMYNAAKYIGDCLDSLLTQTFTDFEVVIVDDCSTDNSVAVVEGYRERFGGRLTLSQTKQNSGGGGYVPRNIGLGLSHGEYIFFVDADDFITKTALEELHSAAKNHDADVVYTGAYYLFTGTDTKLERDGEGKSLLKNKLEDKPTLTIDDPKKNLQRLLFAGTFNSSRYFKNISAFLLYRYEKSFFLQPRLLFQGAHANSTFGDLRSFLSRIRRKR